MSYFKPPSPCKEQHQQLLSVQALVQAWDSELRGSIFHNKKSSEQNRKVSLNLRAEQELRDSIFHGKKSSEQNRKESLWIWEQKKSWGFQYFMTMKFQSKTEKFWIKKNDSKPSCLLLCNSSNPVGPLCLLFKPETNTQLKPTQIEWKPTGIDWKPTGIEWKPTRKDWNQPK